MEFYCIQTKDFYYCSNNTLREKFNNIAYFPNKINSNIREVKRTLGNNIERCNICFFIDMINRFHAKHLSDHLLAKCDQDEDTSALNRNSCALLAKTPCMEGIIDHHQSYVNKKVNENTTEPIDEGNDGNLFAGGKVIAEVNDNMQHNVETLANKKADDNEMEKIDEFKDVTESNQTCSIKIKLEEESADDSCSNDISKKNISKEKRPLLNMQQGRKKVLPQTEGKGKIPHNLTLSEVFNSHCINSFNTNDTFRSTFTKILHFWYGNFVSFSLKSVLRQVISRNSEVFSAVYEWVLVGDSPAAMTVVVIPICRLSDFELLLHQSYGFIYNKNVRTLSVYLHKYFDEKNPIISIPSPSPSDWITSIFFKKTSTVSSLPSAEVSPPSSSSDDSTDEEVSRKRKLEEMYKRTGGEHIKVTSNKKRRRNKSRNKKRKSRHLKVHDDASSTPL